MQSVSRSKGRKLQRIHGKYHRGSCFHSCSKDLRGFEHILPIFTPSKGDRGNTAGEVGLRPEGSIL